VARPRADGSPVAPVNRQWLNEETLLTLMPKERPYLVWDAKQDGLAVAVHPSGNRVWKFIYSHQGRHRWYTIGNASSLPSYDARRIAKKLAAQVADNRDPQSEKVTTADGEQ